METRLSRLLTYLNNIGGVLSLSYKEQLAENTGLLYFCRSQKEYEQICKSLRIYICLLQQELPLVATYYARLPEDTVIALDDSMLEVSGYRLTAQTDFTYVSVDRLLRIYAYRRIGWCKEDSLADMVNPEDLTKVEDITYSNFATNLSEAGLALYGERIFPENSPVLTNPLSRRLFSCTVNGREIGAEDTEDFKSYRNLINKYTSDPLKRNYLLKSKPESVIVLQECQSPEEQNRLIGKFMYQYPYGLPPQMLTHAYLEDPFLFAKTQCINVVKYSLRDDSPAALEDYAIQVLISERIGVTIEEIKIWLEDYPTIRENLVSILLTNELKVKDGRDYDKLIEIQETTRGIADPQIAQLLVTTFPNRELFEQLYYNCVEECFKGLLKAYLLDLCKVAPTALHLTEEILVEHYNDFRLKSAASNLGITPDELNQKYINTFGFNRENTIACFPPKSYVNKALIDRMDGWANKCSYEVNGTLKYSASSEKSVDAILDLLKKKVSPDKESKQFFSRHGSAYLLDTLIQLAGADTKTIKKYLKSTSSTQDLHTVLTSRII